MHVRPPAAPRRAADAFELLADRERVRRARQRGLDRPDAGARAPLTLCDDVAVDDVHQSPLRGRDGLAFSTGGVADDLFVARALQSHEVAFAAIACAVSRGRVDDIYFNAFPTSSADGASVRALVADGQSARRIVARAALTSAPEPASCSTRFSGWAFGPAGSASGVEDLSARSARSRSGAGARIFRGCCSHTQGRPLKSQGHSTRLT